jgi:hypothetical protein
VGRKREQRKEANRLAGARYTEWRESMLRWVPGLVLRPIAAVFVDLYGIVKRTRFEREELRRLREDGDGG